MPRKPAPSHVDPLIAAMIAKLPAPGTEFPEEKQKAWLRMMSMAFSTVYGGDVVESVEEAPKAHATNGSTPPAQPPTKPQFPFMVDDHGFAIRANGKRIMPSDVGGGTLYDMRGEADLASITWADDSTGVIGFDGAISAVINQ